MIQLICNGVEVDVPRGTSIAWKNTNILFAFDKASCERSLTFTLPSTATNDTVFELCRLPQYVGQGFRRLYDAEYRDGLLVKKGYAYVTQAQKGGYNVTLVAGELTALKRLKDAGKVGEVLPDTDMTVSKTAEDANIAEYTGLKVLKYEQTGGAELMPSWSLRPMLVDVLNELQVPFTLPAIAEDMRITLKELKGSTFSVDVTNTRHSDVEYPTYGGDADNKYNTLTITNNSAISVQSDVQLIAYSYRNGVLLNSYNFYLDGHQGVGTLYPSTYLYGYNDNSYDEDDWHYLSDVFVANKTCKITFPPDFPDDIVVKPICNDGSFFTRHYDTVPVEGDSDHYCVWHDPSEFAIPAINTSGSLSEQYSFIKSFPLEGSTSSAFDPNNGLADTTWTAECVANKTLAGVTIEIPAGTRFILARREDFACAEDAVNRCWIYDYQPRFRDYAFSFQVEVEVVSLAGQWQFGKRDNMPDVTAIDLLRTLAAVSGKVLYYTDANGITFEDLLRTDFQPIDLTSKLMSIKTLKPLFFDYKKNNFIKYSDDAMTSEQQMIKVDYETNSAILQESSDLLVLPFSCVAQSLVAVTPTGGVPTYYRRIRVVNPSGQKPNKDILSIANSVDTYLNRLPLVKNATIQQLCKEPLTIEAQIAMSNYEYSLIKPFSLIHLNGVDYVWTESNWQKGTATLTLSKLPLTLSEPQPAPPVLYTYYDYLESDGRGQYIDTEIKPNQDTDIEIDYFSLVSLAGRQMHIFGGQNYWQNGSFRATFYLGSIKCVFGAREINTGFGSSSVGHAMTFVKQGSSITVADDDAGTIFNNTFPSVAYASDYNLALFACIDRDGAWTNTGVVRMGNVRIYDSNDVLVRDFRPAVRIADGVAGMHDVVNDVFYTNANPSGDNFLYGNF